MCYGIDEKREQTAEIVSKKRRTDTGAGSSKIPVEDDNYNVNQQGSRKRSRTPSLVLNPAKDEPLPTSSDDDSGDRIRGGPNVPTKEVLKPGSKEDKHRQDPNKGKGRDTKRTGPIDREDERQGRSGRKEDLFWDPTLTEKNEEIVFADEEGEPTLTLYPVMETLFDKQYPPLTVGLAWEGYEMTSQEFTTEQEAITQTMDHIAYMIQGNQWESYRMGTLLVATMKDIQGSPNPKKARVLALVAQQTETQAVCTQLRTMATNMKTILVQNLTKAIERGNALRTEDRTFFLDTVFSKLNALQRRQPGVLSLLPDNREELLMTEKVNGILRNLYEQALIFIVNEAKDLFASLDLDDVIMEITTRDASQQPIAFFTPALMMDMDMDMDIPNNQRTKYVPEDLERYFHKKLNELQQRTANIPSIQHDWWEAVRGKMNNAAGKAKEGIEAILTQIGHGNALSAFKDLWSNDPIREGTNPESFTILQWFRRALVLTRVIAMGVHIKQGRDLFVTRVRETMDVITILHGLLMKHAKSARTKLKQHITELIEGSGASLGIQKTWETYLATIRGARLVTMQSLATTQDKVKLVALQEETDTALQRMADLDVEKERETFEEMVNEAKEKFKAEQSASASTPLAPSPNAPERVTPIVPTTRSSHPLVIPLPSPGSRLQPPDPTPTVQPVPTPAIAPVPTPVRPSTLPPNQVQPLPEPSSPQIDPSRPNAEPSVSNAPGPGPQRQVSSSSSSSSGTNPSQRSPSNEPGQLPVFLPGPSPGISRIPMNINEKIDARAHDMLEQFKRDMQTEEDAVNGTIGPRVADAKTTIDTRAFVIVEAARRIPTENILPDHDIRNKDIIQRITRIQNAVATVYTNTGTQFKTQVGHWKANSVTRMTEGLKDVMSRLKERALITDLTMDKFLAVVNVDLQAAQKEVRVRINDWKKLILAQFNKTVDEQKAVHEELLGALERNIKQLILDIATQKKKDETVQKDDKKKKEKDDREAKEQAELNAKKVAAREEMDRYFVAHADLVEKQFKEGLVLLYEGGLRMTEEKVDQGRQTLTSEVTSLTQQLDKVQRAISALSVLRGEAAQLEYRKQRIDRDMNSIVPETQTTFTRILAHGTDMIKHWSADAQTQFRIKTDFRTSLIKDELDLTHPIGSLRAMIATELENIKKGLIGTYTAERKEMLNTVETAVKAVIVRFQTELTRVSNDIKDLKEDVAKEEKVLADAKKKAEQDERERLKKEEKEAKEQAVREAREKKEADARSLKERQFSYQQEKDKRDREEREAKARAVAETQSAKDGQHAPPGYQPRRLPPLVRPPLPPKSDD